MSYPVSNTAASGLSWTLVLSEDDSLKYNREH